MSIIKKTIRKFVRKTGFDIVQYQGSLGVNPFVDMQRFLKGHQHPTLLDLGANVGQTVDKFRDSFPGGTIHSFEPSPATYEKLSAHCKNMPNVKTWNCGVGSVDGTLAFQENEHSTMSSFLEPSTTSWGKVVKSTDVPVITLDAFARDQNIEFIHALKSDTQGYDFEVFKGANQLMKENRIGLIYFEITFSDMYKDLPKFDEIFRYLTDRNFALVAFYEQHFQLELVSWTDALFINRDFNQKRGVTLKA